MQGFINYLLDLLNFIVIGLVAWYLGRRYVYPMIQQYMQADLQGWSALESKKNELAKEQDALQELLVEETTACQVLKQKMNVWNKTLEQEHIDEQNHTLEHNKKMLMYMSEHKKERVIQQLKQRAITPIIEGSHNELRDYFKDPRNAQEYIARIISKVRNV